MRKIIFTTLCFFISLTVFCQQFPVSHHAYFYVDANEGITPNGITMLVAFDGNKLGRYDQFCKYVNYNNKTEQSWAEYLTEKRSSSGHGYVKTENNRLIYDASCYYYNLPLPPGRNDSDITNYTSYFSFSKDGKDLVFWDIKDGSSTKVNIHHYVQVSFSDLKSASKDNPNSNSTPTSSNQRPNNTTSSPVYQPTNSSTSQEDNARWETYYRNSYAEWERMVQNTFNSIATYKSQNSSNGSTSHDKYGIYTSSMISTFHQEQQEMRRVRQEAATKGINITISNWETATISTY